MYSIVRKHLITLIDFSIFYFYFFLVNLKFFYESYQFTLWDSIEFISRSRREIIRSIIRFFQLDPIILRSSKKIKYFIEP